TLANRVEVVHGVDGPIVRHVRSDDAEAGADELRRVGGARRDLARERARAPDAALVDEDEVTVAENVRERRDEPLQILERRAAGAAGDPEHGVGAARRA